MNKVNHKSSIVNRKSLGFTLVELLIVVGIIGILATLLMANFIGVRQRARDAQRKSDIRQIQSALEIYRSDIGSYPGKVSVGQDGFQSDTSSSSCSGNGGIVYGTSVYMTKIPCDPLGTDEYGYSLSGNTAYTLTACLENSNDKDIDTTTPNCTSGNRVGRFRFQVTNP